MAPLSWLDRLQLEREVALQHFLDVLADAQSAEQLEIGQAVEEQDPLGQLVGMLHLVDRFVPLELGELGRCPNCRASGSAANIG